jgi:hypothetical protein
MGFVVVTFAAACSASGNRSGHLSAPTSGDLSLPPAPRVAFDSDVRAACAGADASELAMPRRPYLQRVTDRSAMVMWTAGGDSTTGVSAELPEHGIVAEVPSTLDAAGQHAGLLAGLEPSSTYCYSVHDASGSVVTRAGFRTAPAAGSGDEVRFVAIGDMGSGGPDQIAVLDQMKTVPFDLMLTVGDNAYESGTLAQFEQNFFRVYADILQYVPVFPTAGNHDYHTDDAAPFRQVFALPENGGPEGLERWYSFDWGDVHFVGIDTEVLGSAQLEWLEQDLGRNELPWVIVYGHRPPYSSGEHGNELDVREMLSPIFARHGVRVYLAGHDHHYERTHETDGTTYIVTGGGGRGTRRTGSSSFTAFSAEVLHFVWGRVAGDVLELHAIDATGREFDSVAITRN